MMRIFETTAAAMSLPAWPYDMNMSGMHCNPPNSYSTDWLVNGDALLRQNSDEEEEEEDEDEDDEEDNRKEDNEGVGYSE